MYTIVEFQTEEEAVQALDALKVKLVERWESNGEIVENGRRIGVNAKTGEPDYTAKKTYDWDDVKYSPVGTFYFVTPMQEADLSPAVGGFTFEEKPFPNEWKEQ